MNYEVYLGAAALYGVDSIAVDANREVAVMDGVKAGKFSLAQHRALRKWSIQCELTEQNERGLAGWSPASVIFDELTGLLGSKRAVRLVIRADYGRTSERVLLESFSKEEAVSGVYAVKLSCVEYVSAGVKTTDVPYVERPGKALDLPKTAVVTEENEGTIAKELHDRITKPGRGALYQGNKPVFNPASLKPGSRIRVMIESDPNSAFVTEQQKEDAWVAASHHTISSTLAAYGQSNNSPPTYGPE